MKLTSLAPILILSLLLASCTATTALPTSTAHPTELPPRSGTIRFSQAGMASIRDVPSLMAYDALREMGYTVEVVPFAKTSLMPAALEKGDVDFTDANASLIWAAAARGADVRTVAAKHSNTFVFVTSADIKDCRQLDARPVAFATRQSVGYLMFERYVATHCPGATPELVLIAESSNRVAGMMAGEFSGVYLELQDWLALQETLGDRNHVLIDFAAEFPDVLVILLSTRREWAARNPQIVHDYLRELLIAQRKILADRQVLVEGIIHYLEMSPDDAAGLADAYLAVNMWDANGTLTVERVERTLSWLGEAGLLTGQLAPADVADLSYLNAVLDELGRQ